MPMYTCVDNMLKSEVIRLAPQLPIVKWALPIQAGGYCLTNRMIEASNTHTHMLAQSERGKQIFGWVIVVECVAASSFVKQIHKQTSVFDFDNWRADCLDYAIFITSLQTQ